LNLEGLLDNLEKLIQKHVENGNKISCSNIVEIIHKHNIDPELVRNFVEKNAVKIIDCAAGEFGNFENGYYSSEIYVKLSSLSDSRNRIMCEAVWDLSKVYSFFDITSTIKNSDLKIIYCKFGCFREKKKIRLRAKTNIKIQNKSTGALLDNDTVLILKLIDREGSISKAAQLMRISYKKAWSKIKLLEEDMEKIFIVKHRGRSSGGSRLTKEAKELIEKFEVLDKDVEKYANRRFIELFYKDRIKFFKKGDSI
jgi:molybdate transport system regulatory protein